MPPVLPVTREGVQESQPPVLSPARLLPPEAQAGGKSPLVWLGGVPDLYLAFPASKVKYPSWIFSALCEDPGKLLFLLREALPHQPSHVH